jgi:hypothetical protein
MGILLEDIKNYFNNTPKDILEKDWKEKEYLDEIGPDVMEYVDYVREYFGIDIMKDSEPSYNMSKHLVIVEITKDSQNYLAA